MPQLTTIGTFSEAVQMPLAKAAAMLNEIFRQAQCFLVVGTRKHLKSMSENREQLLRKERVVIDMSKIFLL